MENKILNKMLKKVEKDKFVIETPEDEFIFDIKNFNEEDLERIIKDMNSSYNKEMEVLVSSLLTKKDGDALSSDLVSKIVNLKIPNIHSIIFSIMVIIMQKFNK